MFEIANKEKYQFYLKNLIELRKYSIISTIFTPIIFVCWIIFIICFVIWVCDPTVVTYYRKEVYDGNGQWSSYEEPISYENNGEFGAAMFFIVLVFLMSIVQIVFYILRAIKVYQLKNIYSKAQVLSTLLIIGIFFPFIIGWTASLITLIDSKKMIKKIKTIDKNELDNLSNENNTIIMQYPVWF